MDAVRINPDSVINYISRVQKLQTHFAACRRAGNGLRRFLGLKMPFHIVPPELREEVLTPPARPNQFFYRRRTAEVYLVRF